MNVADKAALLTFAPVVPIQITLVPVITPEPAEIPELCWSRRWYFKKRALTDGGVLAGGVAKEGISTLGGVEAAGRIVTKCTETGSVQFPVVLSKRANAPVTVLFAPVCY